MRSRSTEAEPQDCHSPMANLLLSVMGAIAVSDPNNCHIL